MKMAINITYLGHSGFIFETPSHALVIDPFLNGNPNAARTADQVTCDYVMLTHGHGDHLGDGLDIAKKNKAIIIAPYELANYCQWQGVENVHPMHIGGAFKFPFGTVKLTLALHGSAVIDDHTIIYTGNPCGILLTVDDTTLYHAGDTGLFYDMKLLGEMNTIELALLPIGGNFTMDVNDAVKAVELLQPALAVPIHYDTFDVIKAEPDKFVSGCKDIGREARIVNPGDSFEI